MRHAIAALLLFAACTSPTDAMPERWSVTADASAGDGYCVLSMVAEVTGTPSDFSGTGELHVTRPSGFEVLQVTVTGAADVVQVGPFSLAVAESSERRIAGTWECDGMPGAWRMEHR